MRRAISSDKGTLAYLFLGTCQDRGHPFNVKANGDTQYSEDLIELAKFRAEYPGEYETWLAKKLMGIKDG